MLQFVELEHFLWEGDNIRVESWHPCSRVPVATEVADAYLHVAECHEHGLGDSGNARQLHPFFICCTIVDAKERIPIVAGREHGDTREEPVGLYFLQINVTCLAGPSVEWGVTCRLSCWRSEPFVNFDGAGAQAFQLEVRSVALVWMPGWEAFVARGAMEQHHVAQNTLHIEHSLEYHLSESSMDFGCADGPSILGHYDSYGRDSSTRLSIKSQVPSTAPQQSTRCSLVSELWRTITFARLGSLAILRLAR